MLLTDPGSRTTSDMEALFADDIVGSENGRPVATGKAAWLKWRASVMANYTGRVIGYSAGYDGHGFNGALLVIDLFDDFDRSKLSLTEVVDARPKTRSTLYQFGPDHLIHSVQISRVEGLWSSK